MFDQRNIILVDCNETNCLKENAAYSYTDSITGKKLVCKLISGYEDIDDEKLLIEFKKLLLLSGEPEIGSVYFLAKAKNGDVESSCYLMDFIEGQTLDEILNDDNDISLKLGIDILIQIASGMEKAHSYEVFHHDLHENNIMIDSIGYVKIIDFLFLDICKDDQLENVKIDVRSFQEIAKKIFNKCSDKKNFKVILDYSNKIQSFRNVSKQLRVLEEICFDLSLLNEESREILAILIYSFNDSDMNDLGHFNIANKNIPKHLWPTYAEDNETQEALKKPEVIANQLIMLKIDMREKANWWIEGKLNELKNTGLLLWDFKLSEIYDPIKGPFKFDAIGIGVTSKLIKWSKLNNEIEFLVKSDKVEEDLPQLILGNID